MFVNGKYLFFNLYIINFLRLIEFYDIIETPPKATVVIRGKTQNFSILSEDDEEVTFNITNDLSGILELYS